jgi:diguanylate cyclase (GGDEF)-like protein
MAPTPVRALFFVLLAAIGVHAGHAITGPVGQPIDGLITNWDYTACMFLGGMLALARAWHGPRERGAWVAIALGVLLWAGGDLVWTLWLNGLENPPFPSIADGLYLASYLGIYAGVVLLLRTRVRPIPPAQWLDGIVGGLAMGAITAALVFPFVVDATHGTPGEVAVNLAYPACDLLLVSLVVTAIALNRWRMDRSWVLLGLGQLVNAVADAVFTYQEATGTYVAGSWLDTLWPIGVGLTAAAAWQPAPRSRPEDLGGRTLPLSAGFAVVALALLIASAFMGLHWIATLLAASSLLAAGVRGGLLYRDNLRLLRASRLESLTDGLSGLPNRRALMLDLDDAVATVTEQTRRTLVLFDLDGFKQYNDAFGHAAGDALLRRLGQDLAVAVAARGKAYRLGGDEFCALLDQPADAGDPTVVAALAALAEEAEPYAVDASYGLVVLPDDATTSADALRVADHRMYALKHGRRATQGNAREVLLAVLDEREPDLQRHMHNVARPARLVGRRMGLDAEDLDVVVRAAELHDIGKVAIPDAILDKPDALHEEEWAFMRQHTIIGERIVNAADALRPVGRVVRGSHERWDGGGYPDGLAGEAIPLGARIVLACDAWDAMTSDRPYRQALSPETAAAELRAHAGTQFDPRVVEALLSVVATEERAPSAPRP